MRDRPSWLEEEKRREELLSSFFPREERLLRRCLLCGGKHFQGFASRYTFSIVRCRSCGLVMVNPVPSEERLLAFYRSLEFVETYRSAEAEALQRLEAKKTAELLLKTLPQGRFKGSVLDVGCGKGFLLERLPFSCKVGIDPALSELKEAKERAEVFCGTLESVSLKKSFDAIVCTSTFDHFFDPLENLRLMFPLLKPGGWVYLLLPNLQDLLFYLFLGRLFPPPLEPPSVLFFFTPRTLKRLLYKLPFQKVEVRTSGLDEAQIVERLRLRKSRSFQEVVAAKERALSFRRLPFFSYISPLLTSLKLGSALHGFAVKAS